MFRQSALERGKLSDSNIDDLQPTELQISSPAEAVDEIFSDVSEKPDRAAAKVKRFLQAGGDGRQFINVARRLIFPKGRNAHDYKFSSAVLEDYDHVSHEWRDLFSEQALVYTFGSIWSFFAAQVDSALVSTPFAHLGR